MFLSRGLRGCTWPPSRGSRHSASLALWSPELHPHGGQLGLKAYVSLYQVPGGTVMPLSWGGLSQSSRGSVSGRTEETIACLIPSAGRPGLSSGSAPQNCRGFYQEGLQVTCGGHMGIPDNGRHLAL